MNPLCENRKTKAMTTKTFLEDIKEKVFQLAEKYCDHEIHSRGCLYHEVMTIVEEVLNLQRKEIEEMIEKRKSNNPAYVCYSDVNRALSDILNLLKEGEPHE